MTTTSRVAKVLLSTLPSAEPLAEVVLFGFDDRAFPFHQYVQAHLIPAETPSQRPRLALGPGPKGAHDELVRYYGTVIRIDDVLHMWYKGYTGGPQKLCFGGGRMSLCYATSTDGTHWEKPNLGLVEYNGSKQNNIIEFPEPRPGTWAVLYEPDDPDSGRRFKMAYEASIGGSGQLCVAFSPDGLRWQAYEHNPVGGWLELAGLTRFRGFYYVNGQKWEEIQRPIHARRLETCVSADFERWSPAPAMGLERSPDVTGPSRAADMHCHEEIHLGAALWNRGNVILGIYGQWHGHPTGDRRLVTMDLGLALTHDALHYYEPIPGFRFVQAREQPGSMLIGGVSPALVQGQSIENLGEETLFWYSTWSGVEGTGVRVASWERDRLGMLKPFKPAGARALSCPIRVLEGGRARVYVNASGLGAHSQLRIGLLDKGFHPLAGYSGDGCAVMSESSLKAPISWQAGDALLPDMGPVHLDVSFEGIRPEDCSLHAIYVVTEN